MEDQPLMVVDWDKAAWRMQSSEVHERKSDCMLMKY
jgi:hypothetical protein